jgi:hypothetical protein
MAEAGHPVVGDAKYGDRDVNRKMEKDFGLTTQFLHACRIRINRGEGILAYLTGTVFESPLPENLDRIKEALRRGAAGDRAPRRGNAGVKRSGARLRESGSRERSTEVDRGNAETGK